MMFADPLDGLSGASIKLDIPRVPMTRSQMMARIKCQGTKPEKMVEKMLRDAGIHFKRQDKLRPGRPDITFPRKKVAVFVDGDFWHGRRGYPKTRQEFWVPKLDATVRRDKRFNRRLNRMGWSYVRVWETDLYKNPEKQLARILQKIS